MGDGLFALVGERGQRPLFPSNETKQGCFSSLTAFYHADDVNAFLGQNDRAHTLSNAYSATDGRHKFQKCFRF